MRLGWFLTFCRHRLFGVILAGELAIMGVGCNPYCYNYRDPCCAPATPVPSTVQTGPVCDVPTQVVEGGTKLADGSSRSTVVSGATPSTSSRVVVSEPTDPSRASSSWRRSDPDGGLAATTVSGTTNDSSVNR
jgi:hypothetical protein